MAVFGVRAALREECSMPGQERPAARARDADSVVPDDPQSADHAAPGASGVPPSSWLASKTNRPAVAALIATLAAVAFTLARWQTWANGHISPPENSRTPAPPRRQSPGKPQVTVFAPGYS
jgi:hypothetical protein